MNSHPQIISLENVPMVENGDDLALVNIEAHRGRPVDRHRPGAGLAQLVLGYAGRGPGEGRGGEVSWL